MADPAQADELDALVERFGHAQARFDELGGYALESRAREILAGLGFRDEVVDGRRRQALRRLEDARRARAHPPHARRRAPARRADQPPRHRVDHLARAVPPRLRGRAGHDVARSRVPEPPRDEDRRDRRRRHHHLLGQLRVLRAAARDRGGPAGGAVRAPAGDAREGAGVHRPLQGPREPRRAGAVAREEARQDRAGRAAQAPQGARVRLPRRRRARARTSRSSRASSKALRPAHDLRRPRSAHPAPRALVRHGRERRRQVDAPQAHGRRGRSPTRGA